MPHSLFAHSDLADEGRGGDDACVRAISAPDAGGSTGDINAHYLGVTGVFLKPVDAAIVTQTLKSALPAG
jgi:hypothetical protein